MCAQLCLDESVRGRVPAVATDGYVHGDVQRAGSLGLENSRNFLEKLSPLSSSCGMW